MQNIHARLYSSSFYRRTSARFAFFLGMRKSRMICVMLYKPGILTMLKK